MCLHDTLVHRYRLAQMQTLPRKYSPSQLPVCDFVSRGNAGVIERAGESTAPPITLVQHFNSCILLLFRIFTLMLTGGYRYRKRLKGCRLAISSNNCLADKSLWKRVLVVYRYSSVFTGITRGDFFMIGNSESMPQNSDICNSTLRTWYFFLLPRVYSNL